MEPNGIRPQVLALEKECHLLLRSLTRPRPMVSGGLVERWVVCGKAGCRCSTGERHGPYYYRSVLVSGRPRLEYLGRDEQPDVPLLKRYQGYQRQMARLNAIHRELVKLLWQLAESKLQPPAEKGGVR